MTIEQFLDKQTTRIYLVAPIDSFTLKYHDVVDWRRHSPHDIENSIGLYAFEYATSSVILIYLNQENIDIAHISKAIAKRHLKIINQIGYDDELLRRLKDRYIHYSF